MTRKPSPSDVSDEERAFVAPSLTFMTEDAPQRDHALRPPPLRGGQGGARGGAARAGDDGHQRPPLSLPPHAGGKGGGKVHVAVDTLGQLLAAMR